MLIVVVIIGILAATLIPRLQGIQERARDSQRKVDINTLATAVTLYKEDNGSYRSNFVNHPEFFQGDIYSDVNKNIFDFNTIFSGVGLSLNHIPNDPLKTNRIDPMLVMFRDMDFLRNEFVLGHYSYIYDKGPTYPLVFLIAHMENIQNANFGNTRESSYSEFGNSSRSTADYIKFTSGDNYLLCDHITQEIQKYSFNYYYMSQCKIFSNDWQNAKQGQYYVRILR